MEASMEATNVVIGTLILILACGIVAADSSSSKSFCKLQGNGWEQIGEDCPEILCSYVTFLNDYAAAVEKLGDCVSMTKDDDVRKRLFRLEAVNSTWLSQFKITVTTVTEIAFSTAQVPKKIPDPEDNIHEMDAPDTPLSIAQAPKKILDPEDNIHGMDAPKSQASLKWMILLIPSMKTFMLLIFTGGCSIVFFKTLKFLENFRKNWIWELED